MCWGHVCCWVWDCPANVPTCGQVPYNVGRGSLKLIFLASRWFWDAPGSAAKQGGRCLPLEGPGVPGTSFDPFWDAVLYQQGRCSLTSCLARPSSWRGGLS